MSLNLELSLLLNKIHSLLTNIPTSLSSCSSIISMTTSPLGSPQSTNDPTTYTVANMIKDTTSNTSVKLLHILANLLALLVFLPVNLLL